MLHEEYVEINSSRRSVVIVWLVSRFKLNASCNGDHESSTVQWRRHAFDKKTCKRTLTDHRKKAHSWTIAVDTQHSPLDQSKRRLLRQIQIFVRPFDVVAVVVFETFEWCESVVCARLIRKKKLKEFHRLAYAKQNTCKIGKHRFPDWGQTFSQFIRWLWCYTAFAMIFHRFWLVFPPHHFCCWNNQSILHIWHENCGNELIVPLWLNL